MRKALVVGINDYPGNARLNGCVNDANLIAGLLSTNANGSPNFDVKKGHDVKTRAALKTLLLDVFKNDDAISLFYFSGHGCITDTGGYIVTPDFNLHDEGISMDDILKIASASQARYKILILDCCYAGILGTPTLGGNNAAFLEKGVIILASSRSKESSVEIDGLGVFTRLLAEALNGGAADLGGIVTPGNIYSYIDKALGGWQQRPVFKANIVQSPCLRKVNPVLPLEQLRQLTVFFPAVTSTFPLDPSYEYTTPASDTRHIEIFKILLKMHRMGLVEPVEEEYMYWAALHYKGCRLTSLGAYYWQLLNNGRL